MHRDTLQSYYSVGSRDSFDISEWLPGDPLVDSMCRNETYDDSMLKLHSTNKKRNSAIALVALAFVGVPAAGVEVLPARELAGHCKSLMGSAENEGARFCTHYVQGFIDGAVSTDVRVMMNVQAEYEQSTSLTERAARTRMPGWHDQRRAAGYAEFCLGDPLPLADVVQTVARHLVEREETMDTALAARDVVYAALRKHYPC